MGGIYMYFILHLKGISLAPSLHLVEREGRDRRVCVCVVVFVKPEQTFWKNSVFT